MRQNKKEKMILLHCLSVHVLYTTHNQIVKYNMAIVQKVMNVPI